jgi:endo-1,3-1,4-beta-glycanase ExoK
LEHSNWALIRAVVFDAFSDNFSNGTLNSQLWTIDTGSAPGNISGVNVGTLSASNVDLTTGMLRLTVTQTGSSPVTSVGAEVRSIARHGYGTYTWTMRAASTATTPNGSGTLESGQIPSGFLYFQNPTPLTEIDSPEIEGPGGLQQPRGQNDGIHFLDKRTQDQFSEVLASAQPDQGFHSYKTVWVPGSITYYVDGVQVAQHTTNVPTQPAYILEV